MTMTAISSSECDTVVKSNVQQAHESIDALAKQLAAVTAERDRAAAIIDEQTAVIQRLRDSRDEMQLEFTLVQLNVAARIS